ncbi:MAG: hypothetical protein U0269_34190 [Polyangiales bacterium]
MRAPYRSATLVPPASFEWPAAAVIARWAIALRVVAAIIPWLARGFAPIGRGALALEIGACTAMGLASWRLFRAAVHAATRRTAALSTALAALCVLLWQPLASGFESSFGPHIQGDLDTLLGLATFWRAATWLSLLILWVTIRLEPSTSAPSAAARELELAPEALRAQSLGLRAVSSGIAGIVGSMVGSIVVAISLEIRGAHWHTSAFVRGAGIILAGLFAARTLSALSRLQRWSPSISVLSGGLALWACSVVGWLFVIREWLRVLLALGGRALIPDAFAVQGLVATTTLVAITLLLWAALQLGARAGVLGHRALWWASGLGLATTTALMARVHVTIPDFVMRTPDEHRLVALTLATAMGAIVGVSLFARRIAAGLDQKSTELVKKSV